MTKTEYWPQVLKTRITLIARKSHSYGGFSWWRSHIRWVLEQFFLMVFIVLSDWIVDDMDCWEAISSVNSFISLRTIITNADGTPWQEIIDCKAAITHKAEILVSRCTSKSRGKLSTTRRWVLSSSNKVDAVHISWHFWPPHQLWDTKSVVNDALISIVKLQNCHLPQRLRDNDSQTVQKMILVEGELASIS